nr:unnamed protein product [Callosobruchus analis]
MLKNENNYCGRCEIAGTRNTIYEELAKYVLFPCVNETCTLQLQWGHILNHEGSCPHKVIWCPFINCAENYKVKDLLVHFDTYHTSHLFFVDEITAARRFRSLDFSQFVIDRRVYCINHDNFNYLVMVYMDAEKHPKNNLIGRYNLSFGVYSVQRKCRNKCYKVDIQVTWNSGIITNYNITDQPILQYNDRVHCLKCIQGICSLELHENKKQNFLPTKLAKIQNIGDMSVQFNIALISAPEQSKKAKDIHANLKCTICGDFMCSPIHICSMNHAFCINCKRRLLNCNICKTVILDSRNTALETLAEKTEIHCHNQSKGCNYIGIIRRTKQHQLACKYNFD